jgi:hypothetical protein
MGNPVVNAKINIFSTKKDKNFLSDVADWHPSK